MLPATRIATATVALAASVHRVFTNRRRMGFAATGLSIAAVSAANADASWASVGSGTSLRRVCRVESSVMVALLYGRGGPQDATSPVESRSHRSNGNLEREGDFGVRELFPCVEEQTIAIRDRQPA